MKNKEHTLEIDFSLYNWYDLNVVYTALINMEKFMEIKYPGQDQGLKLTRLLNEELLKHLKKLEPQKPK